MVDKLIKPKYKDIPDKINEIIDNLGTSTGANIDLSNLSSTGESKFQEPLVSGMNIKTINGTSILDGGNLNTSEIFIAEYGVTPIGILIGEFNGSKCVILKVSEGLEGVTDDSYISLKRVTISGIVYGFEFEKTINGITYQYSSSGNPTQTERINWNSSIVYSSSNNDLSNLSATGQAIIDGKVNKSGDTMTGGLEVDVPSSSFPHIIKFNDVDFDTPPSSDWYSGIEIRDKNNNRMGRFEYCFKSNGEHYIAIVDKKNSSEDVYSVMRAGFDVNGNPYSAFANSSCCDGQWVAVNTTLYSSQSLTSSSDANLYKTVSLPNDGHIYEVAFRGHVTTGSASGNNISLNLQGNVLSGTTYYLCGTQTRSSSTVGTRGFVSLPMRYGSNNLRTLRRSTYTGTAELIVIAYRRIGTNA